MIQIIYDIYSFWPICTCINHTEDAVPNNYLRKANDFQITFNKQNKSSYNTIKSKRLFLVVANVSKISTISFKISICL